LSYQMVNVRNEVWVFVDIVFRHGHTICIEPLSAFLEVCSSGYDQEFANKCH